MPVPSPMPDDEISKLVRRILGAVTLRCQRHIDPRDPIMALPAIEGEMFEYFKAEFKKIVQENTAAYENFAQAARAESKQDAQAIVNATIAAVNKQVSATILAGCGEVHAVMEKDIKRVGELMKHDDAKTEKGIAAIKILCYCALGASCLAVAAVFYLIRWISVNFAV